jgi:hypothetical protein
VLHGADRLAVQEPGSNVVAVEVRLLRESLTVDRERLDADDPEGDRPGLLELRRLERRDLAELRGRRADGLAPAGAACPTSPR